MLDSPIPPCPKHRLKIAFAAAVVCLSLVLSARADVFELHTGGSVHGLLINKDESPRKTYVVKTHLGGEVTLAAEQVKKVSPQTAAQVRYDQIRFKATDTVEDQWKLAEWCKDNRLLKERRKHLERIVELEPNHTGARHGLGYSQVQGRWVTHDAMMAENGYQRYKGAWLLPQEIEIKERTRKDREARLEWGRKLKRWHQQIGTNKEAEALAGVKAINDPFAVDALARMLNDTKQNSPREVRMLYVEALGRINDDAGMGALVTASLYDPDEEVRLSSLDQILDRKYKPAVKKYVQTLRDKENTMVNRAGYCLGKMNDPDAIAPLIDALVTVHTFKIQKGQPGQTQATFGGPNSGGGGGGGFTFGGSGVEIVKQSFENRGVLEALSAIAGTSFNYDQQAWKKWYAAQHRPASADTRRDGASTAP
jgi:hypothetical protein